MGMQLRPIAVKTSGLVYCPARGRGKSSLRVHCKHDIYRCRMHTPSACLVFQPSKGVPFCAVLYLRSVGQPRPASSTVCAAPPGLSLVHILAGGVSFTSSLRLCGAPGHQCRPVVRLPPPPSHRAVASKSSEPHRVDAAQPPCPAHTGLRRCPVHRRFGFPLARCRELSTRAIELPTVPRSFALGAWPPAASSPPGGCLRVRQAPNTHQGPAASTSARWLQAPPHPPRHSELQRAHLAAAVCRRGPSVPQHHPVAWPPLPGPRYTLLTDPSGTRGPWMPPPQPRLEHSAA
ncbi:hypothetical protein NDU88_004770 [Pleurodeles waltl]|uniref:Uncharacterized protein n=1 Tax=Pleurodeles waltl TaxID=8319 RepID=A0AAV7TAK3_PLEWA|nr:hypothetical protein NDU88_004770 [Pleurodeles waltl]